MRSWLDIASGIVGLAAAIAWFFSARILPAPSTGAYFDVVDSPDMPFHRAWRKAGRLNQWAAALTGLSVLLLSVAQFIPEK